MPDLTASGDITALRVVVRGRVQGVFFRDSTRRQAQAVGVAGWVRNAADGSVEAWLEGPSSAVAEVATWIRDGGPPHARVDAVEAEPRRPEGHEGFTVRS